MKNIIYTVAMDDGGTPYHLWMAMLLISSIRRSGFDGKVMLFTDAEDEPFADWRSDVEQVRVELTAEQKAASAVFRVKYLVADLLPRDADWLMYMDPDCLVAKNPALALDTDAEVLFAEEPWDRVTGGQNNAYLTDEEMKTCTHVAINAGFYAHRGHCYHEFVERWKGHERTTPPRKNLAFDQPPFVRTILDWEGKVQPFREPFSVLYPEYQDVRLSGMQRAGLLHFNGVRAPEKLRRMLGFYMMRYGESAMPFIAELLKG